MREWIRNERLDDKNYQRKIFLVSRQRIFLLIQKRSIKVMYSVAEIALAPVTNYLKCLYQNLSYKQLQAVELIAEGEDVTQVSRIIGVGRDTVWRWCNREPLFAEAVETYGDLLNINVRVNEINTAVEIHALFKKRLESSEFQLVINCLKLEVGNLQALYPMLKSKKLQAIMLFARGESVVSISKTVGVSRGTASRWCNHDPIFQEAVGFYRDHIKFSGSFAKFSDLAKLVELLQKRLQSLEFSYTMYRLKLKSVFALT